MLVFYLTAVILLIIDQLIKFWTVSSHGLHEVQALIPNFMSLHYIQNSGAAWGIFEGKMIFFYIVTLIAVGVIIHTAYNEAKYKPFMRVALSFILAGAVGNFIDRLRLGYVIDMFRFDFINFPIFNFADICLTVGVILLIIKMVFVDKEGNEHG